MMVRNLLVIFLSVFLLSALSGCQRDKGPEIRSKTVIVYIVSDNNLNGDATDNVNQMERAYTSGNLIVYADSRNNSPRIYKISKDQTDEVTSRVVKTYEEHDSTDPVVMRSVLEDIVGMYPAQSYGLILWSHATAWYPASTYGNTVQLRWFGDDGGEHMDISGFDTGIPDNTFDYIIFDACLMSSVEVAYELRYKADYLLASPTVTLSAGMPYETITPMLLGGVANETMLRQVGQAFYDYYNAMWGQSQTGNIALIDLAQMDDLARVTKELLSETATAWPVYDNVQRLCYGSNLRSNGENMVLSYDFQDFLEQNFPDGNTDAVREQLEKTVIYKATTGKVLEYPLDKFSGIGSYIPRNSNNYERLNTFYQTLGWYEAAGYSVFFGD